MATLKEYKNKLTTLKNIKKMTKTMKMVSASKLRQFHRAQANAKLYAQELTALIARLEASVEPQLHPLLLPRENVNSVLILIFTSDKGLCASFNHNIHRLVSNWLKHNAAQYQQIGLSFCGKKGATFLKQHPSIKKIYPNVTAKPDFAHATLIGKDLINSYLSKEFDEVYLVYNRFNNPLSQIPIFERILPIKAESLLQGEKAISSDYIFEPAKEELLELLIPKFLYYKLFYTLLENSAGEHGARMTAMDKATENASELIDKYTLLRNRARQAAITKELIEIISGAEALK